MSLRWILMVGVCLWWIPVHGQGGLDSLIGPDAERVMVYFYGGDQKAGRMLSDDGREIKLETEVLGIIFIQKEQIESIIPFSKLEVESYGEDYRTASSFATRYYLTANAIPVKKGDHYGKVHLFGMESHFGLTEQLSAGVLTTWVVSPIIVSVKYSLPIKEEYFHVAGGSLIATSGYLNTFAGGGGLHYGVMTIGDRIRNVSFQAGYFHFRLNRTKLVDQTGWYEYGEDFHIPQEEVRIPYTQGPAFGVGGIAPLGKRYSFVFESMFFFYQTHKIDRVVTYPGTDGALVLEQGGRISSQLLFIMPSIRYQDGPNKAIQMGLPIISQGRGTSSSFPGIGYSVAFFYKF
jgi:hypothetical protein